nr:MAG TPA: hypothetical protein [Caudoviricetes sp.]
MPLSTFPQINSKNIYFSIVFRRAFAIMRADK